MNGQGANAGVAVVAGQAAVVAAAARTGKKFQPLAGPEVPVDGRPHPPRTGSGAFAEDFGEVPATPIYSGVVGEAKTLQEDMDAQRWAAEFMQAAQFTWSRGEKIDKPAMLAWFANSIMCGYDEAVRRSAGVIGDLRNENFSLKRIIEVNRVSLDQRAADRARLHLARRVAAVWAVLAFLAGIVTTLFVLMGFAVANR